MKINSAKDNAAIFSIAQKLRADLRGFGAVKQEFWIEDNYDILHEIGVRWAIGSGGTFEFVSKKIKHPPTLIKRLGFFSFYRLIQEPKNFRFKRILLSFGVLKYIFKR